MKKDTFNNNQLAKNVDLSMSLYNFGNIKTNDYLTEDYLSSDLEIGNSTDIISSSLNGFNVDQLLKDYSNSIANGYIEKSKYKLLENMIFAKNIVCSEESHGNLCKNFHYYSTIPVSFLEYTNIKIENLNNTKENITNNLNPEENVVLTYKNPNSKKFIFEGKDVGKNFKDAKPEEIFLVPSDVKYTTSGDTLKDMLEFYYKDNLKGNISLPVIEGVTYYIYNGFTYNDTEGIFIGYDINTKNLKNFKANYTLTPEGTVQNITFEEVTNLPDPNMDYEIILEEITNKEIITNSKNISDNVLGVPYHKYNTLTKCHIINLEKKNPLVQNGIFFYGSIYCIDSDKNFYISNERKTGKQTLEFYNYDAAVEKTEFLKDYIRKKLNIN